MSRRILVADDSSTIQKVIKIALSRHPIEIVEAGSFIEALTTVSRQPPDLLILDASLPGARGPEDFAKLAAEAKGAPLLLLVGTYDSVDEGAFRQAGFQQFLKKPFESVDIVQAVEGLLGQGEGETVGRGGAYASAPPADLHGRAQHATVIHEGGYQTLSGFDPTRPPPPPTVGRESALELDDEAPSRPTIPPPPPMTDHARKGRRAFDGDSDGAGRAPGGFAVPPPPVNLNRTEVSEDDTAPRRPPPPPQREPSPLPPIPPGTGLGASGISLSLDDEEGFKPSPLPRGAGAAAEPEARDLSGDLPAWVRVAVEDYCERHFKSLAREIIASELRRLADDKARHLVDN